MAVTTCPAGCYNLPWWLLQLALLTVTTCPGGCYNLPCWLLQLALLAVTTCPADCYNLPCWLLQLALLAVTTCPAGCYNLPCWLLQLALLAVTTCPAGCYNCYMFLLTIMQNVNMATNRKPNCRTCHHALYIIVLLLSERSLAVVLLCTNCHRYTSFLCVFFLHCISSFVQIPTRKQ